MSKNVIKVPKDASYGTGKRKTAIAKVWLFKGSGKVYINQQEPLEYLKRSFLVSKVNTPLSVLKLDTAYDVFVKTLGGGLTGQAEAIQLGIAKALVDSNESFKKPLREQGLLTRNAKIKERKKYGLRGARKRPQYRKR